MEVHLGRQTTEVAHRMITRIQILSLRCHPWAIFSRFYTFALEIFYRATFVGLVYGYATTLSSSITVPMASHALNNFVGGIIWRYSSNSSKQIG